MQEYGVKSASVFGSVARGEAGKNSDVDILIKIGKPMGMLSFVRFSRTLCEQLGRKVDVVTEAGVNRHLRPFIESDLKYIYEEA